MHTRLVQIKKKNCNILQARFGHQKRTHGLNHIFTFLPPMYQNLCRGDQRNGLVWNYLKLIVTAYYYLSSLFLHSTLIHICCCVLSHYIVKTHSGKSKYAKWSWKHPIIKVLGISSFLSRQTPDIWLVGTFYHVCNYEGEKN